MTPSDVNIVADNIEDFIEVPDGINRLRKAVLTLAVSGKLVPQDSSEGTAEDLYNQIQTEKAKAVEGKKKKVKELPEITKEEIPFDIPTSWKWVRVDTVADYLQRGKSPKYIEESNYPVVSQKCVRWGNFDWNPIKFISPESLSSYSTERFLQENDVLINSTGTGTVGRACIFTLNNKYSQVVADGHVTVARFSRIDPTYVTSLIATDFIQASLSSKTTGSTNQVEWSLTSIQNQLLPLPPFLEQQRIIKKVKELMSKIDELEIKKKERDETRIRLARSAMQSLGKGNSKIAFEQLTELIKTPSDIKELENSLLTLAVSGKLVPQDESEGTAEDLYRLIERNKVTKEKKQKVVTKEEEPFLIPKSWAFIRLGNLVSVLGDGLHGTPEYCMDGKYYFINGNNLASGKIEIKQNTKQVSSAEYEKYKKNLTDRTVFVSINGTLGNFAFYNEEKIILGKSVCYFNLMEDIDKDYVCILIKSPYFLNYALNVASQTTIKNISLNSMRLLPIPLPPFAEQKRIVKKVEEIMVLTNKLKSALI